MNSTMYPLSPLQALSGLLHNASPYLEKVLNDLCYAGFCTSTHIKQNDFLLLTKLINISIFHSASHLVTFNLISIMHWSAELQTKVYNKLTTMLLKLNIHAISCKKHPLKLPCLPVSHFTFTESLFSLKSAKFKTGKNITCIYTEFHFADLSKTNSTT